MSFGIQEKVIRFRIMANGSWTTPFIAAGRGINTVNSGLGVADGVTSVTRLSAGKFQVTLDDAYAKIVTVQTSYSGSSDTEDLYAQGGVLANVGTSTPVTLIVKTKTGTANTDPGTTDVNTHIDVDVMFEDSAA